MDQTAIAEIQRLLERIAIEENVSIPLAVESGSRAWGFPSPDSDYDCRFVYVRKPAETFTLFPARDVIERPPTPTIDVSGWELSKALKLLLRGNAVIIEWITSPYAYRVDEGFRRQFRHLASRVADRNLIGRHYFHLAENQYRRAVSDTEDVVLKKLFYILRPFMALRWLEKHVGEAIAPMHFGELCKGADLEGDVAASIAELIESKAQTRELGRGVIPAPIQRFLKAEYSRLVKWRDVSPSRMPAEAESEVDQFWRVWVERLQYLS